MPDEKTRPLIMENPWTYLNAQQNDGTDIVFPTIDLQGEPSETAYTQSEVFDEKPSTRRGGQRFSHPTRPETAAGLEAVALVDAEIERLPPIEELDYSELAENKGGCNPHTQFYKRKRIPDDLPRGHPECLRGKTFVLTGLLPNLTHVVAEEIIRGHGGRVKSSIGREASFLLVGQRSMKTKCEKLIKAADFPKLKSPLHLPVRTVNEIGEGKLPVEERACDATPRFDQPLGQRLWTDKHRPQTTTELLANPNVVRYLQDWVWMWHKRQSLSEETKRITPKEERSFKRAALLTGPPGSGKTTAAFAVVRDLGYEPISLYFHDTETAKEKLKGHGVSARTDPNLVMLACQNRRISWTTKEEKPRVIILDGVDGYTGHTHDKCQYCVETLIAANEANRMANLIASIKVTRIPVICVAGDHRDPRLAPLKPHCVCLSFKAFARTSLKAPVMDICSKENRSISDKVLGILADMSGGDFRAILNGLQTINIVSTNTQYKDVNDYASTVQKSGCISVCEAIDDLLSPNTGMRKWQNLGDGVSRDLDFAVMLLQDKYIDHMPDDCVDERDQMKAIARAAKCFSLAERMCTSMREAAKWSLLSTAADMAVLGPATIMRGCCTTLNVEGRGYAEFLPFYESMAVREWNEQMLKSTATKFSAACDYSIEEEALLLDYLPLTRLLLTAPLIHGRFSGVSHVLAVTSRYHLDKEHYDYVLHAMQFSGEGFWAQHPFVKIERNVRAVLTRNNNAWQKAHPTVTLSVEPVKNALAFLEDSLTVNPDSCVIRDGVREEERGDDDDNSKALVMLRREALKCESRIGNMEDAPPIILPDVKCVTATTTLTVPDHGVKLDEDIDCLSEETV